MGLVAPQPVESSGSGIGPVFPHWQAGSEPPDHQGSSVLGIFKGWLACRGN